MCIYDIYFSLLHYASCYLGRFLQQFSHFVALLVFSPMNMLDGCENRLAYCAAFGAMTFELTSILWNPYGRFTSFGLGYQVKNNALVSQYPSLRGKSCLLSQQPQYDESFNLPMITVPCVFWVVSCIKSHALV